MSNERTDLVATLRWDQCDEGCKQQMRDKKALHFSLDEAGIASRERDAVELVELRAALAAARRENDWLRAYTSQSAKACVYCGLGADEQGRCERGFPGCARADDQMLCREVGVALERDALRAENEALRKDAETLQRVEKRIEELWDTVAPVSYDDPGSYRRGRTIGTADTLDAIRDAIYAAKERTP